MLKLPPPLDTLDIRPPLTTEYRFQRGAVDANGRWFPLMSPKGYGLYNCYKRNILAAGSRKSSKTVSLANRFIRHAWEVDGAVAGVVAKTTKNAKIGVWRDLWSFTIPGWVEAQFGFKVLKGPCTDAATKMEYIIIRNGFGGESELQLHSLDYDQDVEEKFKSARFTAVWLSEADQFKDRCVYNILEDQLRVISVPYDQHHFFFDCNPPEEGDEHWLHDLFYKAGDEKSKYYIKNHDAQYEKFEFGLDDNPFLDPRERDNLVDKYRYDPVKSDRFINGKWVKDTAAGHFDDTFMFNIHVVGKADSINRSEWEVLTPYGGAEVLITGSDIGDLNHATTFICPRITNLDDTCYDVFDEVCSIGKKIGVEEFSLEVWKKVQFWQQWFMDTYKTNKPPEWRHWGDSSLFNYSATANNNDAQVFWDTSDGNIVIRPVTKGAGSIRARIGMAKRLFHSNRLLISAHCRWNIGWARFLKPGKSRNEPIQATNEFRHGFDSCTYAIGAEMPHELQVAETPSTATGLVSIG